MKLRDALSTFQGDFRSWSKGWGYYLSKHARVIGGFFEKRKDIIVDILTARRGTYQWPFLHISLVALVIIGYTSAPLIASVYPGNNGAFADYTPPSAVMTSLDPAETMQTQTSEKPRDQIISYTVKDGDTLAKIAAEKGVSVDSIKWLNDIKSDSLSIGQVIKIPPVTGIVHKVKEGETIYSIAKKYKIEAQNIVNFPFNDYADPETFALNVGQTLIVPDGVMPEAPAIVPIRPTIIVGGTGQYGWPTNGVITQYPSWYHMAIDIANAAAPGIVAADRGTVTLVEYLNWGYGYHVIISHGNGMQTLYGHMQAIYVKPGDVVSRGQVIGKMGSTGRSTGTHLHFEVRQNGVLLSPLNFLR